jgi:hypothetical protein
MEIVLDPSEGWKVYFFYHDRWNERVSSVRSAGGGLNLLASVLAELGSARKDISAIGVVMGQGSFTSTRVATTIANSMAFACKVPVYACVRPPHPTERPEVFFGSKPASYVSATYSGAPRLGGQINL